MKSALNRHKIPLKRRKVNYITLILSFLMSFGMWHLCKYSIDRWQWNSMVMNLETCPSTLFFNLYLNVYACRKILICQAFCGSMFFLDVCSLCFCSPYALDHCLPLLHFFQQLNKQQLYLTCKWWVIDHRNCISFTVLLKQYFWVKCSHFWIEAIILGSTDKRHT